MSSSHDGWIESIDPNSGRTFYANRFTRTTQWEPPAGWKTTLNDRNNNNANDPSQQQQQQQPLPDGWEEMNDPNSGRTFYIDHARQITTWERPGGGGNNHGAVTAISGADNNERNLYASSSSPQQQSSGQNNNDNDYLDTQPIMKINQYGSHSHWDDDPHTGSRNNNDHNNNNHHYYINNSLSIQHESTTTSTSTPPPPRLNFKVLTIPDSLRPHCPTCFNPFSYTRRRHHCRLCGDIFCDACSNHRTVLPLEGEEFDKAVRVCDVCMRDVKRGNYFSWRRYLTSLELFSEDSMGEMMEEEKKKTSGEDGSGGGEERITLDMVAASLSSLSTDIDAMLLEPLTSFTDKMTIPANVLVPAVSRHLKRRKTGEYAIRVLATLLQLGSVVGDDSFGLAVLGHSIIVSDDDHDGADDVEAKLIKSNSTNSVPSLAGRRKNYVKDVLKILEWNGNDIRTLSAQEQAVKVIYYITDPNFIAGALSIKESLEEDENNASGDGGGPVDVDAVTGEYNERMDEIIQIDVHRAFRSMLDLATSSASPSLQRWATACLRHLIAEDERRACSVAHSSSRYESFTSQLVSTGGVMILCSLLNSDDGETRAHATSALEAIVIATREIGLALNDSPGKGRGLSRVGRGTERDSAIVDAIISNVGGSSLPALAHLLTSADESVSMMGCSFILSLISPLLTDPRGSGRTLQQCSNSTSSTVGFGEKDDGLSSYRNAAIALVVGDDSVNGSEVSCLPSLIEIVRSGVESSSWGGGNKARPIKVQVKAAECIAAVALAVGHTIRMHTDQSSYHPTYVRAKSALEVMEQERLFDVALQIIKSDSHRSLDASRDTPDARLREAACLVLLALSSCSMLSSLYLMSNGAVSTLLSIASEPGMLSAASTVRGKWASKGLCFLEAATTLLIQVWTTSAQNDQDSSTSASLNLLLEALNSGAVVLASRLVKTKVTLKSHDLAYSQLRVKIAICFLLSSMFGIANKSHGNDDVGASRLYSAIDADCAQFLASGGDDTGVRTDLVGSTLNLLNATLPYAHQFTNEDADEPLPMVDLSEACLLVAGSMCGLADPIGVHSIAQNCDDAGDGKYSHLRLDACTMACNILTAKKPGQAALLPTVLVGAIGESLIVPSLRLSHAICTYGSIDLCGELSQSGIVPVGDILQRALSSDDYYTFSIAVSIVKCCGQCTVVGRSASGTIETLKSVIRTLSSVLALSENENGITMGPQRLKELSTLKYQSLVALEALSANDVLQTSIATTVLPALVSFLQHLLEHRSSSVENIDQDQVILIGMKIVQILINIPSSNQSMMSNGIGSILISVFEKGGDVKSTPLLEVALEIMQSIAQTDLENRYWLTCSGLLNSLLSMIGESHVTERTLQLSLQNVGILLSDLKPSTLSRFESSAKDELLKRVVAVLCTQRKIIRRLIANISDGCDDYGESFVFPHDGGEVRDVAAEILFNISTLLLVYGRDTGSTHFNDALMLNDVAGSNMSVATACSALLDTFSDDDFTSSLVTTNPDDRSFYFDVQLPTVKSYLMEGLTKSLKQAMSSDSKTAAEGLIERLQLPRTCLLLCRSEKLAEPAFRLFEDVVLSLPIDFVGKLILCDRVALVTLFDLVTGRANKIPDVASSKQTFAKLLGNLAKAGLLPKAVSSFGLRSHAIAALSAAMLINEGEENIDEDEGSIQRICLESLAIVLCGKDNEVTLTPVESRTLASAIGKVLSSTVLNRFFTQASLEATINDATVDFQLNRDAICQAAESRLLCAMAHSPEALGVLSKVGGLEAIGLIAHEGEIRAVEAIQKACDVNPKIVVDVDAHLSIMDALIGAENKLSGSTDTNLCNVVLKCLRIVTTLSANEDTRDSILHSEQSHGCVEVASSIVSAGAELKIDTKPVLKASEQIADTSTTTNLADSLARTSLSEELQIDDLVHIDSTSNESDLSPENSDNNTQELEGVVAYVGSVQFAPGDCWIGIRLTGSSVGKGSNDGSVKGTHYFDCEEKCGVFVQRSHVRKRESESTKNDDSGDNLVVPAPPKQPENPWRRFTSAVGDGPSLEEASFALLQSFSRSKEHRDAIMSNHDFTSTLAAAIRSSTNMDFKRNGLELLSSFVIHYCEPEEELMQLFCDVIETQTRSLQLSRDRLEQSSLKHVLGVVVLGLQNLLCCYQNTADQTKPLRIASDLFIFMSNALFSGPRSRRMAVSKTDGILFSNLTSLFVLLLGDGDTRKVLSSSRHVSSLVRFIMMTSGVEKMDCHIALSNKDGEEYWEAAHTQCLQSLMFIVNEASQLHMEKSYSALIKECEPSSNAFSACLRHISERAHGGAPAVSARYLLMKLERLS